MKIFHGKIITCDWEGSVCEYLVENGGKIIYVGDRLPEAYSEIDENVEFIELGRQALLPAFGDGHIHFSSWALFNSTFDVLPASSIAETGKMIELYAEEDQKAKVLFGFGHSPHKIQEKRLITRTELDQFVKDRPVFLVCYEGHSAVVNTRAIGIMPFNIRNLRGFDLETGQVFYEAFQEAVNYISGKMPVTTLANYMLQGMDDLAAYGVGLVHTTEGLGYPRDLDVDLVRFLSGSSQLRFRVYFQTMTLKKVLKRGLPRVGGCFECALDGSLGTRDAALLEPYADDDQYRGLLYYSDEQVYNFVREANRAELQVQLHCAGDAAVVQAVDAIEAALKDYPREDHRHTLIHAPLIPEGTLEKIAGLGIGITIQPAFLVSDVEPAEYVEKLLGERINRIWPLKKMLAMGLNVSGGSDGPVLEPDPVTGIFGACNHPISGYSADIEDALSMYTYNIAHTSFDENERGSLEAGKEADMVVLSDNPLEMETGRLTDLKVEKLYLSGEEYQGLKSASQAIIKSLKNRFRAG